MITKRDKQILIWIEKYGSITINQCSKIFFTENKEAYDQARKRLKSMYNEGVIKRYRKDPRSEAVYYMDKRLKTHDLKIFDVVAEFYANGYVLHQFDRESTIQVDEKKYVLDAKIVFRKDAHYFPVMLEIDYSHLTGMNKIEDIISTMKIHKHKKIFMIVRISQETMKAYKTNNKSCFLMYLPWNLAGINILFLPAIQK